MADSLHEHDNAPAAMLAKQLEQLDQQLAAGSERMRERRAQHHAALSQVKVARAGASDLSWELADLEQRLRDLQEQRAGPRDPLLEREFASITGQRGVLEEQVLAQMLLVDELAARAAAEEQALIAEDRAWADHAAVLQAEHDQISALLEHAIG
jgi:chromosome segregation ATPase